MEFLKVSERVEKSENFRGSDKVNEFMKDVRELDREAMWVLHLDTRLNLIDREMVSLGIVNASLAHPREIFRKAIIKGSCAIILVHNHPSGDCTPSQEDFSTTNRIKKAAEILGIDFLDHLIITPKGNFYSFADNKTL